MNTEVVPGAKNDLPDKDNDEDGGCCFIRKEIVRRLNALIDRDAIEVEYLHLLKNGDFTFGEITEILDDAESRVNCT